MTTRQRQDPLAVLRRIGLLLLHDRELTSLATIVARGPVAGSWWGHPRGKAIYRASVALMERPDVITAKLVRGKVTFVHGRLWPALVSVGLAANRASLSAAAAALLAQVEAAGRLRTTGPAAKELERALAVHSEQVHTPSGAHATELESWSTFAHRRAVSPAPLVDAEATLAAAIARL